MRRNVLAVPVKRVLGSASESLQDLVAVEEPLEIRIGDRPVSITMRTPGNDLDLAVGFLFGEGILTSAGDIEKVEAVGENVVRILLQAGMDAADLEHLERNFYMSSSCGVCGKASIEAVHATG